MSVRKPWVVAVWRTACGPGAAANPQVVETVHVFESAAEFVRVNNLIVEGGHRGRWVKVYDGDPRPATPDWQPGDFEYATDKVTWHGGADDH